MARLKGERDRFTGIGSVTLGRYYVSEYSGRPGIRLNNMVHGQRFANVIRDNS